MESNTIIQGDALSVLQGFPEESIDLCVTSPPYWSLRDYNTEPLVWDGYPECEHEWQDNTFVRNSDKGTSGKQLSNKGSIGRAKPVNNAFCSLCGAWRGSLGLEPTPDLFISHLCTIFDQVKRVLKKTGSCYVNIGDSYSGSGGSHKDHHKNDLGFQGKSRRTAQPIKCEIKPKSLVGIPYRFALEMMNRGWILRNELIWHKPNAMPSSVKDRFTTDFEPVFFFTKSGKYYFEQQFEPLKSGEWESMPPIGGVKKAGGDNPTYSGNTPPSNPLGRNRRCVWTIPTAQCKESHYATFPEDLVKTPILASCPPGGIVLDCFAGAGTTLLVAEKLNRKWIGIDLSGDYIKIARSRIHAEAAQLKMKF